MDILIGSTLVATAISAFIFSGLGFYRGYKHGWREGEDAATRKANS